MLEDEDNEILSKLKSANDVAQEMEQKLDSVLNDLDRLLGQLDSGDMNQPTSDSYENPIKEVAGGDS